MNSGVPKGKLYMEEYNPEWAVLGRDLVARLKGVIKRPWISGMSAALQWWELSPSLLST